MRRSYMLMLSIVLILTMTGCEKKSEETLPSAETAQSETAAIETQVPESTAADAVETAIAETAVIEDESDDVGDAGDETAPAATLSAELAVLQNTARAQNAVCSVAYLGGFDEDAFYVSAEYPDITEFTRIDEDYRGQYPFIFDIPTNNQVAVGGTEVYCIVPTDPDTVIKVSEFTPIDSDGKENIVGNVMLQTAKGESALVACNVSDIMSNVLVEVTTGDGQTVSFSPGLSLRDGSVMLADGVMDFTIYGYPIGNDAEGYTDEQLCQMALDYYEAKNDYRPGCAVVDSVDGDEVTIHLYDDMTDHTATADWYTVDRMTGIGTDFMGDSIDLSSY